MRVVLLIGILLFNMPATSSSVSENIIDYASFKLTIHVNGEELEWEYENPNEFEFEKGTTVTKGKQAKKEVLYMFELLNIKEDRKIEDLKDRLVENGFDNMDEFVVRVKHHDEQLSTWKWTK